jgi:hypothetical protein
VRLRRLLLGERHRSSAHHHRLDRDEEFAQRWSEAVKEGIDTFDKLSSKLVYMLRTIIAK